jgi:hypothetical protein
MKYEYPYCESLIPVESNYFPLECYNCGAPIQIKKSRASYKKDTGCNYQCYGEPNDPNYGNVI